MSGKAAACVALAVLSLASPAAGDPGDVAAGRAAFQRAGFAAASTLFTRVLEDPAATRADLLDAHRYLAAIGAAFGDAHASRLHADAALALDPAAEPPEGASPDLVALFDGARAARAGSALRVAIRFDAAPSASRATALRVTLAGSAPALGVRVGARCTSAGATVLDAAPAQATDGDLALTVSPLAARAPLECTAVASSASGVELARATVGAVVAAPPIDRRAVVAAPRRPRAGTRTNALLVAGISAGAVAVVAAAVVVTVVLVASRPATAQINGVTLDPR